MNHSLPHHQSGASLYDPANEHDACGVGMVAKISGQRSNEILRIGLRSICSLMHRGALDADARTGDGAGISTQIPYKLFKPVVEKLGHQLYRDSDLGVGVMYLPGDNEYAKARAKAITEEVIAKRGLCFFGWREVPTNKQILGTKALMTLPDIEQVLVGRPWGMGDDDYERRLFLARNEIEDRAAADKIEAFYIPSFSHRVIVYKGLLVSSSLEKFFPDLSNPSYETALCVYHQRYSTNTFPTWPLAHPFRMMAHNGEINTVRGNRNWTQARESELKADFWGPDIDLLKPIIQPGGSDSASLDNVLEILTMSGRSILHAMTMLVPPAWHRDKELSPELAAFYEYHTCLCEPWDGPAALVFTDGITIGACLDRNGLRPARYQITDDGIFSLGSEMGVDGLDQDTIIEKGRLAPGEMIAIDTAAGVLLRDREIKADLATRHNYRKMVDDHFVRVPRAKAEQLGIPAGELDILDLTQRQVSFGYTSEELDMIFKPMIKDGAEAVGSMGDDTPLAVLSLRPRLLYTYFSQLFAQVTNPPIDPIRERLVMSLFTTLGWRRNLLSETPEHAAQVSIDSPILFNEELEAVRAVGGDHKAATLSTLWKAASGASGLAPAVRELTKAAEKAVDEGARILILSDKGVDHENLAIPAMLAVGAVHHHLRRVGKRMRASFICETGEARDVHQMACLIGYGVSGINPYLAIETIREMIEKGSVEVDFATAQMNYKKALQNGILKIMSKMGISVVSSYRGAQIFEATGISSKLIEECFTGTPSQIEGIGFEEIARESLTRHELAYAAAVPNESGKPGELQLGDPGYYRIRRGGELHAVTPPVIKNFHTFVRTNKTEDYKAYVDSVMASTPHSLRNLLECVALPSGPVPIDEVESIEEIRRRFTTAGMSLGALSPEAHEMLAIAMNRIGGKSNSGEGGEDPRRFKRLENGDWANSAIKQIASGRFGVSAAYLASAKEIEIKMAQGAKPGEGGQLPGHKVSVYIAKLRHAVPGVTLISPPPHHDIYSIEDLAQLIYDLKQVNPRARVTVKLVAEAGVGTIAAGVAKAHADIILVSGHEGGTGASPLSSVKHAGGAWELGVAETHQVLLLNGLRNRVTLRTDGGMRSGEDIIHATLLGAEEYNFGTAALIAMGCVYVRQCHLNTCPVGVATLDDRLRAKFKGKAENVVNFFNAVAEEVREILAQLGYRSLIEVVGRSDLLRQVGRGARYLDDLDLNPLLTRADGGREVAHCTVEGRNEVPDTLDAQMIRDAQPLFTHREKMQLQYSVRNTHRAVGTRLAAMITRKYGMAGLQPDTVTVRLRGSAGQSLGAFAVRGVKLEVFGDANDYVGKGLSGGTIVVKPTISSPLVPEHNAIIGNTVLYGATAGKLFACGTAGERFAVRNSGADAVVEGLGSNGCEYMTGGTAVVLGNVGVNFGAGMTGGMAFVYDPADVFALKVNPETVAWQRLDHPHWEAILKSMIEEHVAETKSPLGARLLNDWAREAEKFWQIVPKEMLTRLPQPLSSPKEKRA